MDKSKTLEELVQEEKDLLAEREKRIKERDDLKAKIQGLALRDKSVATLASTIDARADQQQRAIREMEEKEKQKTFAERNEGQAKLADKELELKRTMTPRDDAQRQLAIVQKKIELLRERWETRRSEVKRDIAQTKYSHQMLRVRAREIQRRIEMMKAFLKEKHPEVNIEEDALAKSQDLLRWSKWRAKRDIESRKERKLQLESECRRLMDEKKALMAQLNAVNDSK